ncbi:hypothetical protein DFH07DRAFT_946853 [Mycena maculata]|uniref:NACHT domain-containing protein n=1 Tax=Mycena maculata TaxID=230809 RepID=A0AAD7MKE9_9AGAR|nr:hypothetical protein DFH07DRAFT_946853 [Mycena maculata]
MSTSGSPPRKRPRSETLTLTPGSEDGSVWAVGRYTLECVQTYLSSLRAVSTNLDSLADPLNWISLPFPSLLRSPIQSLDVPTGQYRITHMGRPTFSTIVSQIQRLDRQIPRPIVLLSTYGAGTSHLLAVLASFLFSQGKRVVFLPESPLVADDPILWLKLAFALPFADLPEGLVRISQFRTTDDFLEFTRGWREDIYFLVDGFDRLEGSLKEAILALTSSHFHVYTACTLAPTSTRAVSPIRIPSGLTSDEFADWMTHFEGQVLNCNATNLAYLQDLTGGIPALHRRLLEFPGAQFSSELAIEYRMGREFQTLADNITEFHTNAVENFTRPEKSRYLQLMSACLTETIPEIRPGSNTGLYDPRYFYFDDDGRGHCVCGLARDTMIPLLRMEDLNVFTSDAWYSAVRCGRPSTRNSAIAQICLTRIGAGGLTQADAQGHAMRVCTFRQNPVFGWMFEEAWRSPRGTSSFLCIPGSEVCTVLNAVILRINPSHKTAHLLPLQISTAQTCTDLASLFFAVTWHRWEAAIKDEGFKVVNTFVCVDSHTPESADVISAATALRDKVTFISPQYTVRNLTVGLLDPKLGRILQGDKYQTPPV